MNPPFQKIFGALNGSSAAHLDVVHPSEKSVIGMAKGRDLAFKNIAPSTLLIRSTAIRAVLRNDDRSASLTTVQPIVENQQVKICCDGNVFDAQIYIPRGEGPFPLIVVFRHADRLALQRQAFDSDARELSQSALSIVFVVDWRVSRTRLSAACADGFAVYQWSIAHAASFKGDPTRLSLAGMGASANLAIATAIAARDLNLVAPLAVLAVYQSEQPADMPLRSCFDIHRMNSLNKEAFDQFIGAVSGKPHPFSGARADFRARFLHLPPIIIINAKPAVASSVPSDDAGSRNPSSQVAVARKPVRARSARIGSELP